ncbi:MAG: ankyrin repeat domain-containing protein [Treponemataceae bacterium]|nr:ankyrin repeat domain-containing protein [Treponemataceae bacterium]
MKGLLTLRKSAVIIAVCMAVLCLPGYSEPTPEQIAERTRLLFSSVKLDDIEWAKLCIEWGAYVNARIFESRGLTALMVVQSGDMAKLLIKAGADVNAKSYDDGKTALIYAAMNGHKDVVELLIKAGADVNVRSVGLTALSYATRGGHANKNIANLLRAAGATE